MKAIYSKFLFTRAAPKFFGDSQDFDAQARASDGKRLRPPLLRRVKESIHSTSAVGS